MEIIKGKNHLKETTVEDIVHQDRKKNHFFMGGAPAEAVDPSVVKATLEGEKDQLEKNQNKRQKYNNELTTLDEDYAVLKPLNSFIVRLEIRGELKTKSGLWLPSIGKVKTKAKGTGFDGDDLTDPYEFTSVAVIVAVPVYETELKQGDVVQIVKPQILTTGQDIVGYEWNYAHPDYKMPVVPTDPEDKHFGYAIIPRTHIKVVLQRQSLAEL